MHLPRSLSLGVLSVVLLASACGEGTTTPGPADLSLSTLASPDSAGVALFGMEARAAPILSDSMVLDLPSSFTITLVERECAAPVNTVTVVSPTNSELTGTMCQEPVGTEWTFTGPYDSGEAIILEFIAAYNNYSPAIILSGSFPSWDAWFEDGYDQDFDDFLLRIVAQPLDTCQLFQDPGALTDPLLLDATVQAFLKELWYRSDPLNQSAAMEYGGYLVDTGGSIEMYEMSGNANPQKCTTGTGGWDIQAASAMGTIVGFFHTHPHTPNTPLPPDGSCLGYTSGFHGEGPSQEDKVNSGKAPFPQYIIDQDNVYRLKDLFNNPIDPPPDSVETFPRNPTCAVG